MDLSNLSLKKVAAIECEMLVKDDKSDSGVHAPSVEPENPRSHRLSTIEIDLLKSSLIEDAATEYEVVVKDDKLDSGDSEVECKDLSSGNKGSNCDEVADFVKSDSDSVAYPVDDECKELSNMSEDVESEKIVKAVISDSGIHTSEDEYKHLSKGSKDLESEKSVTVDSGTQVSSSDSVLDSNSCTTEEEKMVKSEKSDSDMSCTTDDDTTDSKTPTKSMFNAFAPAPESLGALAPIQKRRILKMTKMPLRRRLLFDLLSDSDEEMEPASPEKEDPLLESINKSLLELVVSSQAEELSIKDDVLKTPTCLPLLTGIADTCPGAPMRDGPRGRKLDESICRKLDFESILM